LPSRNAERERERESELRLERAKLSADFRVGGSERPSILMKQTRIERKEASRERERETGERYIEEEREGKWPPG